MTTRTRLIVGLILLLAATTLGYVGYAQWILPDLDDDAEEPSGKAQEASNPGPLYEMPEIVTDIADTGECPDRYVSVQVVLECEDDATLETVDKLLPQIQDVTLEILRDQRAKDLEGSNGMRELRTKIILQINRILNPARIRNVYLTSLVIQ